MREDAVAAGARDAPVRAAFLAACIVFFVLFVFAPRAMLGDPDTLWHVHFGQYIARTMTFPVVDEWSATAAGERWITKEWLSQLLYAGAYQLAGYNGVVGLAASAIALAFGVLTCAWLRRLPPALVIFCVGAAFCLSVQHFLARPHVLAYPLMAIWVSGLARACDEARAPSRWLLVVLVLWANMHGGFSLGLVLAVGFAATAVWESKGPRSALARAWGVFLVLAIFASGLTPYGFESLLVTPRLMSFGSALSIIVEWRPPDLKADKVSLLVLLGWVSLLLRRASPFSLPRIGLVLLIVYLFLTAARNGEVLGFVLPFVIPAAAGRHEERVPFRSMVTPALVASIAFLLSVGVSAIWRKDLAPFPEALPEDCLRFARESGIVGDRLLNGYEFGGYLITQGVPTFIDGRAELFGPDRIRAFNDFQLVRGADTRSYLDLHGIVWTLLDPQLPVVRLLDQLPGWQRVFGGGSCVIHRRVETSASAPVGNRGPSLQQGSRP
ncbi:MAG: hypothetical protein U1E62_08225 [Alsobacter sp.]